MPDYVIFGRILRSEFDLGELTPSNGGAPHWTLSGAADGPLGLAAEPLGSEPVQAGVAVTLYRGDGLFRLTFDDTGSFDVSTDGREIRWAAPPTADLDAMQKDVIGRVLPLCLELQGTATLHGSAVDIDGSSIAFLAPKFHGKSTTAAALVARGARLLADDAVAVTSDTPPLVVPSVPVVQLWEDSAERIMRTGASRRGDGSSVKLQIGWDDAGRRAVAPVPFAAAYVLSPVRGDLSRHVRRERLPAVQAALALLGQSKIVQLLGTRWRASLLSRLVSITSQVPVYRLEIPRDYDRLNELTDALWAWHAGASAAAAPAP